MAVGVAEVPSPWLELATAGFRVRVDGERGRIRIPIDRFNLLFFLIAGAVLATVVFGVAVLIGLSPSQAGWLAMVVLAAVYAFALHKRRSWMPFDLVVDLGSGEVVIPNHTALVPYGGRFNAHDVVSAGVDWARGHGERARQGAPIAYFIMFLRTGTVLTDPTLNAGRLDAARARTLVLWFYRYVIPEAVHGDIDAEP